MKTSLPLLCLILCAALCGCAPQDGYGPDNLHVGDRILLQPHTGLFSDMAPWSEVKVADIKPHILNPEYREWNVLFQVSNASGATQWYEEVDVNVRHL